LQTPDKRTSSRWKSKRRQHGNANGAWMANWRENEVQMTEKQIGDSKQKSCSVAAILLYYSGQRDSLRIYTPRRQDHVSKQATMIMSPKYANSVCLVSYSEVIKFSDVFECVPELKRLLHVQKGLEHERLRGFCMYTHIGRVGISLHWLIVKWSKMLHEQSSFRHKSATAVAFASSSYWSCEWQLRLPTSR